MKNTIVVPFLLVLFLALGCAARKPILVKEGDCYIVTNSCSLKVKQTKFGIDVGGFNFTSGPVSKVGEIKVNTDLLQKMTDIAQIMDQDQFAACQTLNRVMTCDKNRDVLLAAQQAEQAQITQLALLMQGTSGKPDAIEKVLEQWILRSADLMDKIYAKQFTGTNPELEAKRTRVNQVAKFAMQKLNVSPGTPEYEQALMSPIQRELQ